MMLNILYQSIEKCVLAHNVVWTSWWSQPVDISLTRDQRLVIQCNRCIKGVQVEYDQHYRTGRIVPEVIDAQLSTIILMVAYGFLAQ